MHNRTRSWIRFNNIKTVGCLSDSWFRFFIFALQRRISPWKRPTVRTPSFLSGSSTTSEAACGTRRTTSSRSPKVSPGITSAWSCVNTKIKCFYGSDEQILILISSNIKLSADYEAAESVKSFKLFSFFLYECELTDLFPTLFCFYYYYYCYDYCCFYFILLLGILFLYYL